ncbi:MAG: ABC transporter ATP-binding protein, partial [Actinomycetota bacterium]
MAETESGLVDEPLMPPPPPPAAGPGNGPAEDTVTPAGPPTAPLPPSGDVIVSTRGLTKVYGKLTALDHLDLDVPAGSIFGIIGPNGAGKSTTFAILSTLLRPTSGTATVCGANPTRAPKAVRRRLGYMPDVMGVYDRLRVDEYLEFHAASYGVARSEWPALIDGLLELVDLDVKRDAMVDGLSRG